MYKNTTYDPEIDIRLYPGIYTFLRQSAVGKTRLCKALKALRQYGEPVYAFTYSDYLEGDNYKDDIEPGKFKVIMLDRFDMYTSFDSILLEDCADDSIILIDYKGRFPISMAERTCDIKLSVGRIEVTDDLYF